MIDAAIVGLGWWGQKIVKAVQGRSSKIRFVRGVTQEPESVQRLAEQHDIPLSTTLAEAPADDRVLLRHWRCMAVHLGFRRARAPPARSARTRRPGRMPNAGTAGPCHVLQSTPKTASLTATV